MLALLVQGPDLSPHPMWEKKREDNDKEEEGEDEEKEGRRREGGRERLLELRMM